MTGHVAVWERLADALLAREAALCRVVSGVPPRDGAGLFVGDEEVDRLLRTLPGLDGPDPASVARIRQLFDPLVEMGRRRVGVWWRNGRDPLAAVARRSGADAEHAEVLALLTAVELDPQRQRLVAYVQDSVQLPRPTLATLRRVLGADHPGPLTVAPSSPLSRCGVVQVDASGPWATRMCGVAPRVVWAVLGDTAPDPDLPVGTRLREPASGGRPVEVGAVAAEAAAAAVGAGLLLVHGADPESRRRLAAAVHGGRPLLCAPAPSDEGGWLALAREAVVTGAVVVLEVDALDAAAPQWIERLDGLAWVLSSPFELPMESLPHRPWRELGAGDGQATAADWADRFGTDSPAGVRLSREQLRLVAVASGAELPRVAGAVRRLSGGHLDRLAVRVRPRRGWSDLVLPEHQASQLRQLSVRHREKATVFGRWGFPAIPSSGVVSLFAGPSGTGKTLAAEVVAGDLGLDLYKVDLSSVVSKYVGETEKNLERIFTAAAAGDLVLFFDEADALFGKRSEVSSSHDRYANIEVAYLLQRLETYDGLVVLATNLQRNIDEAFLRRIGIAVTFPAPDEDQRRRIWSLVFPPDAPVEDLDLGFLARQFAVPGGTIRSAALGAAFAAAEQGSPITMELVALAMKREFAKLGRLSTQTEFARYFDVVQGVG